jgi:hypothetical protein
MRIYTNCYLPTQKDAEKVYGYKHGLLPLLPSIHCASLKKSCRTNCLLAQNLLVQVYIIWLGIHYIVRIDAPTMAIGHLQLCYASRDFLCKIRCKINKAILTSRQCCGSGIQEVLFLVRFSYINLEPLFWRDNKNLVSWSGNRNETL